MADNYFETIGSGSRSGDTITRIYNATKSYARKLFDSYTHNQEYDDGFFNKFSSSVSIEETHAVVTLVFQEDPAEDYYKDGDATYNLNASTIEKPLEKHPNYKTIWNHDLWQKLGSPAFVFPYQEYTNTLLPPIFREWVKWSDGDAPPEGWYIAAARTKPGVEAYIYPSPVVSVTRYYKKREKAAIDVRRIASLQAPGFCFGYSQERINWIISSSGMSRQGRLWTVTTEHMYASEGWDIELYA